LHGTGRRGAEMCSALRQSVGYWEELDRNGRLRGGIRDALEKCRAALAACPR
jgi:hypothetical protein